MAEHVVRQEYASSGTLHLNYKVQYECFTPGKRDTGRTPQMPVWAADNPFFFCDFTNRNDSPSTQTKKAILNLGDRKGILRNRFQREIKFRIKQNAPTRPGKRGIIFSEICILLPNKLPK